MNRLKVFSLLLAFFLLLVGCTQSEQPTLLGDWRLSQVTEELDGKANGGLKHPIRAFTHWQIGEEWMILSNLENGDSLSVSATTQNDETMKYAYTLLSAKEIQIADLIFSFTLDQHKLVLEQERFQMVFIRENR